MSEPRLPLSRIAAAGDERLVGGAAGVEFVELRPGSIAEVACWPGHRAGLEARLALILGIAKLPGTGRATVMPDATLCTLGRGRVQVFARSRDLVGRLEEALPSEMGAVVDLSHGRAGIGISGRMAVDLLQKGLAFDLDERAFPATGVAQSTIHHMPVTVIRLDRSAFELYTFRSFAAALLEWLSDAAIEFGWRFRAAAR